MYIFVKGRFIRYLKSILNDGIYTPIYLTFYNNKIFITDTKSDLKRKLSNDIEKKIEKDEYYKRY